MSLYIYLCGIAPGVSLIDGLLGLREFLDSRAGEQFFELREPQLQCRLRGIKGRIGFVQRFSRCKSALIDLTYSREFALPKIEVLRCTFHGRTCGGDLFAARAAYHFIHACFGLQV